MPCLGKKQRWGKRSRFLINQWSVAFGDLGGIWTVIEYPRLFRERFHLDEGSLLFSASFSPQTPPISPAAPLSNVRPPGIHSCRAESGAARAATAPLPSGEPRGAGLGVCTRSGTEHSAPFCANYEFYIECPIAKGERL